MLQTADHAHYRELLILILPSPSVTAEHLNVPITGEGLAQEYYHVGAETYLVARNTREALSWAVSQHPAHHFVIEKMRWKTNIPI